MNINIKHSLLVVVFALAASLHAGCMAFGYGNLHEPVDVKINLEEKNIHFKVEIDEKCGYELGIRFAAKNNDREKIKLLFGKISKLDLPAKFTIAVFDKDNHTVFQRDDFGGTRLGYRHGGSQVKFIAGHVRLPPGIYQVKIQVLKTEGDFNGVLSSFFINYIPKTHCN